MMLGDYKPMIWAAKMCSTFRQSLPSLKYFLASFSRNTAILAFGIILDK